MAQAQTNTTPNPSTNGNTNGNTNGTAKRDPAPLTPIDAVAKISRILKQLSPADRKRVLDFVDDRNSNSMSSE
jgi:hypothetical protein